MKKTAKRALLMSAISMLLCISMLVGTTFAWFTDSVTSGNNVIASGNLDIELEYWDGAKWENANGASNILDNDLWEPGVTEVVYLKVKNAGSLALKYNLGINIVSETSGVNQAAQTFSLSDYIYFDVDELEGVTEATFAPYATREQAMAIATQTTLIADGYSEASEMASGEERYLAMVVYMPESVGNAANHNGENVPQIQLGIKVIAMQATVESDSFDELYDDLATFEDGGYRVLSDAIGGEAEAGSVATFHNRNNTFRVTATAGESGQIAATIDAAPAKIVDDKAIVSYDIDVTGQEPGSEVTVELFIGQNLMCVELYHEGVAMPAADYSYDPNTGIVTLKTTSFSVYEVSYVRPDYEVASFADFVKGQDATHVLVADIVTSNIIHFGNGTHNHLDLNGHTVTAEKTDQYAFGAQMGSTLHLCGNGTANVGKGFMTNKEGATIIIEKGTYNMTVTGTLNSIKHHALAQNDSKIIINGGTFTSNVEDACLFFATSNSRIEINGGFFVNTADKTPDLLSMGTNKYNTNRIILRGGTFVNYNPLEDRMCYTGEWPASGEAGFSGPWMLIPGGYTVVSETQSNGDVWYSVVPVQ